MNRATPLTYARWLRRRMRELKLGVAPLARQVGKTRQQVGSWRRGDCLPPMTQVPLLALVLGTDEQALRERILRTRGARHDAKSTTTQAASAARKATA